MNTSGPKTSERRIRATSVSRGIGIGQVVIFTQGPHRVYREDIPHEAVAAEVERLAAAAKSTKSKINELAKAKNSTGSVFGAHLLIVDDSPFIGEIEHAIRERRVNAEWAVRLIAEHRRKRQTSVADEAFREKAIDIVDVAEHLIDELCGSPESDWSAPPESIVVAAELLPSHIVTIAKSQPGAIITERGGWTSHSAIIAREAKIPMVTGVHLAEAMLAEHDNAIVDAFRGEVIIDPEIDTIEKFTTLAMELATATESTSLRGNPCITRDGTEIAIRANAETAAAYAIARAAGAVGIGLFRSEALIKTPGQIPTEDEQVEAYLDISDIVGDEPLRIRTFDLGLSQFSGEGVSEGGNPSLGLRAIRLSLAKPEYFRVQLRALLRASAGREIDIILPMITGLEEIIGARDLLDEERENLLDAGLDAGDPRLGAMIEVPSAVFTAREIAENVDFLCLGTNDLVQYLLAVDRDNEAAADWYQTLHPAVFRAIKQVIDAANAAGISAVICGEMAGSPFYVAMLIGGGARELSMNVNSVQNVRRLIAGITIDEAVSLFDRVVHCKTAKMAEAELRQFYIENWYELFPPDLLAAKHR